MASAVPEAAQRPIASFPAVLWAFSFSILAIGCGFASLFLLTGAFFVIALVGAIPTYEGPMFMLALRKIAFKWKQWRMGTTYRREISSTQMVLQRGVTPMKGLFKVEWVLLEFKTALERSFQIPALLNQRRHTILVESGTNQRSALADSDERRTHENREAGLYRDLAAELGEGNSFTVWSMRRRRDESPTRVYLGERLDKSLRNPETEKDRASRFEMEDSHAEITDPNWETRRGLALTASNPSNWKVRSLDKLTSQQLQESPAVRAALMVEDKMTSVGISDARVCSVPRFLRILREVFSVRDLELPRHRALEDSISEDSAGMDDQVVDRKTMFTTYESPFPMMQREMANDHLLFDGTFHRVMWVTNYLDGSDEPDAFDNLYTAKCEYFVGVYGDIVPASRDDSDRQDKGRFLSQVQDISKRNRSAQDEQDLDTLNRQRYDALRFGQYVVYFRTLVIVSGSTLEDLEDNQRELFSHLAKHNVRVQFHMVRGGDQLKWFFAALGSFGA